MQSANNAVPCRLVRQEPTFGSQKWPPIRMAFRYQLRQTAALPASGIWQRG
jgi:hypothetical protein